MARHGEIAGRILDYLTTRPEEEYTFKRSFSLPAEVQTEKASAKFKDGVLEIRIPKTEEAKEKEKKVLIE